MPSTLLLNASFECIAFVSERKAMKLISKNKVEILSRWDDAIIRWGNGYMNFPATLKLKHHVRWIPRKVRFNRIGVFKRDLYQCQYCGEHVLPSKATLDHIVPRVFGGENSWKNCVTACFDCNNKKGNNMLEKSGLKLLKKPSVPKITIVSDYYLLTEKHEDWKNYIVI